MQLEKTFQSQNGFRTTLTIMRNNRRVKAQENQTKMVYLKTEEVLCLSSVLSYIDKVTFP